MHRFAKKGGRREKYLNSLHLNTELSFSGPKNWNANYLFQWNYKFHSYKMHIFRWQFLVVFPVSLKFSPKHRPTHFGNPLDSPNGMHRLCNRQREITGTCVEVKETARMLFALFKLPKYLRITLGCGKEFGNKRLWLLFDLQLKRAKPSHNNN